MTRESVPAGPPRGAAKADLLASLVVFLVALPLCMGIALASGVPPAVGLITGIVGGLVVGTLSGSPLQVSGPAAGLTVLIWELVRRHGVEALGPAVLLAGAFQLAAGLLRLGRWFRAVSPAVVEGMLAGIGVLIIASQFHVMVDDRPRENSLQNLLSIPEAVWRGVVPNEHSSHEEAALLGLLTIGVILAWKPLAPRRLQILPAPLLAVALATAVAALLPLPVQRVQMPDNLLSVVRPPTPEDLGRLLDGGLLGAALALALIASAETLLSATAVGQMRPGVRTHYDRELAAQGVGNVVCGALGALPLTGVIVRSAANVQAGARTRWSAILHGVWLLGFVALAPGVLAWVPTSSLAAVLVYTGYKLINLPAARALGRFGRAHVAVYAVTAVGIVATDLLTGVLLGMALSAAELLYRFSRLRVRVQLGRAGEPTVVWLRGAATFLRLPSLAAALESVPHGGEVVLEAGALTYLDAACLKLLAQWKAQHEAGGGRVEIDWKALEGLAARRGGRLMKTPPAQNPRPWTEESGPGGARPRLAVPSAEGRPNG
jgi:MFS superfamily sulfate permease-like transporter